MFAFLLFTAAFAANDPQVRRVTPQGETKLVRQIRVEFTQPIVRFGAADAAAPLTGDCLKNGEGRWIDSFNWVFDFKEALGGGLRCHLKLREALTAVDGKTISGKREFAFTTGGPAILRSFPESWNPIDEEQAFVVVLDAPVDPGSIPQGAFLSVQGLGDRLPVRVLSGSEEEGVLKAFMKASSWSAREVLSLKDGKLERRQPLLVLKSDRRFPFGSKVTLHWGPGVKSALGVPVTAAQSFEYDVRPEFSVSFSCQREESGKPCIPLLPMSLSFTAPVKNKDMRTAFLKSATGRRIAPDLSGRNPENGSTFFEFKGPFEAMTDYEIHLPGLKDDTGRNLANAAKFPLRIATGENPPLLKFAADFGVVEAGPAAALPVTVRDIEKKMATALEQKIFPLTGQVQRVDPGSFAATVRILNQVRDNPYGDGSLIADSAKTRRIQITKPHAEKDFEVVAIPFPQTGFYFVEMSSPRLGAALLPKKGPFFVRSTVLVTNLAVHLKYTTSEVFAWVTTLADAQSVAGAEVNLVNCRGQVFATAKSGSDGTVRLKPAKSLDDVKTSGDCAEFFVSAAKSGDFSFTSSEWDRGIESWRYRVNTEDREPLRAHTVLDRSLLRPEETVSMKHVLRRGVKNGFATLAAKDLPPKAIIEHESELQSFELPLKWNTKMGTAENQWKIPAGAKLGRWSVFLVFPDRKERSVAFRVEHYKVPLLKGHLQMPDGELVSPSAVPVHLGVEYLAGGGAGSLEVKTRWSVEETGYAPEDDELQEYSFLNGGVKEGLLRTESEDDAEGASSGQPLKGDGTLKLETNGTGAFRIGPLRGDRRLRVLRVEAEYRDPNGEIQTVSTRKNLWPADRLIGIKALGWGRPKNKVSFEAVVLDLQGKPVPGAEAEIELFKSDNVTHRKRLVGGFYGYESYTNVKRLGRLCKGKTDNRGRLNCTGAVSDVGTVRAVARLGDRAEAQTSQWVVDDETQLWFGSGDADRVDLLPAKKRYEPGETAEFLFQAPFRRAKVLVTIEREGVIEHRIIDWDAKDPSIRLPVQESWAPNVFVSAMALRGRVGDVKPTALVDLGKPAFKMGLTEIRVGWKKYELKVKVATDAKVYPVRGKAKAFVKVTDTEGRPVRGEISLAAVDEGLLQLLPNASWQLLERMMDLRALLVRTSTAQTQVIGKRHYGLKAVAAGGDGGGANLRELFETLLLWKGTVPLNAKGEATVEIPINDSLTSFRVVAIALNGKDQFGTGSTSFSTTQELMIFSGAPTFARDGDKLFFTTMVRNTGLSKRDLEILLKTDPVLSVPSRKVSLTPGQATEIAFDLVLPSGVPLIKAEVIAQENGRILDRLLAKVKLAPVWRSNVRQSTLVTVASPVTMPVEMVGGALPGSTNFKIEALAGLASGREGLREFWANYRYNCLEQKVSRVVTLNDGKAWAALEAQLDSYMDEAGRLKFFPGPGRGDVMLNAYVLAIANEAGFQFAAERERRLLEALVAFAENRSAESGFFRFADEPARRMTAMETLSRYKRFSAPMLSFVKITPNLWPTSTVEEWFELLRRTKDVPNRTALLVEAENVLRSRMVFTGGKFAFSDEKDDQLWWLYRDASIPMARLILATVKDPTWKGDLPRVLRGFIDRQKGGAWELTTSNAWGRLALDRYKGIFEKDPVTGRLEAMLAGVTKAWDWSKGPNGEVVLPGPTKKDSLKIQQKGAGKPYALVRVMAAVPLLKPVSSGYFLERKIEAVVRKAPDRWTRGDLVQVTLKIRSQADAGWVVIDDPLPPGTMVLGSGLGNDSNLVSEGTPSGNLWSTFEERGLDSYRLYFAWVPRGEHTVSYRARLNQAGSFRLPATRVEAMYDPDVFAETPNGVFEVAFE